MNTHILIPIKDIDERINDLRLIRDKASEEFKAFYASAISELMMIKDTFGKQISLDEKDIDAEGRAFQIERGTEYESIPYLMRECYKQALKDLL